MSIEIPPALQWISYLAGSKWPQGDEDGLWRIGEHWHASAAEMSDLIPDLNRVRNETMSVITGETANTAAEEFAKLFDGDYSVEKLVEAMAALGETARQAGTQVEASKIEILVGLAMAAAEILYAIAMAPWTFGASMAWIPPIEALTMAAIRALFNQLLRALVRRAVEALTKTTVARLVREAAKEGVEEIAEELITNLAIQQYQIDKGHKDKIDWNDVGDAAKGAAAGGAAAGLFHAPAFGALGGKHGKGGIGNAFAGAGASYGSEVVAGVVGAVAVGGSLDAGEIFAGGALGGLSGGIESSHGHGGDGHGGDAPHGTPTGLDGGKSHAFDSDGKGPDGKGPDDRGAGSPDAAPPYEKADPHGSPPPFELSDDPSDGPRSSVSGNSHDSNAAATGAPQPQAQDGSPASRGGAQGGDAGSRQATGDGQAGSTAVQHDLGDGQNSGTHSQQTPGGGTQGESTQSTSSERTGGAATQHNSSGGHGGGGASAQQTSSGDSTDGASTHQAESPNSAPQQGAPEHSSGQPAPHQSHGQDASTVTEHRTSGPDPDSPSTQRDSQPTQNSGHESEPVPHQTSTPSDTPPTRAETPPPVSQSPGGAAPGSPITADGSPSQAEPEPNQAKAPSLPEDSHQVGAPTPDDHPSHVGTAPSDTNATLGEPAPPSAQPNANNSAPLADSAGEPPPATTPSTPAVPPPTAPAVQTTGPTSTISTQSTAQPAPPNTTASPTSLNSPTATPPPSSTATHSSNATGVANPGAPAKSVSAGLGTSSTPAPTAVSNVASSTASASAPRSTDEDQPQVVVGVVSGHMPAEGVARPKVTGGGPPPKLPPPKHDSTIEVSSDETWRHDPATTADWFEQSNPTPRADIDAHRDETFVQTVDAEVANVLTGSTLTHIPTPHTTLIRYDLRRIEVAPNKFVQEYTVKLNVSADRDPALEPNAVADVQAKVTAGVDGLLNRGNRLPSGDEFRVKVEFTDTGAHAAVLVGNFAETTQTTWRPDASENVLAHEILHYLGVPDEGRDSRIALRQHDQNSGVHGSDGGMMGPDVLGDDPRLRPRHLWMVERTANSQVSVPTSLLTSADNARTPLPPKVFDIDDQPSETSRAPKPVQKRDRSSPPPDSRPAKRTRVADSGPSHAEDADVEMADDTLDDHDQTDSDAQPTPDTVAQQLGGINLGPETRTNAKFDALLQHRLVAPLTKENYLDEQLRKSFEEDQQISFVINATVSHENIGTLAEVVRSITDGAEHLDGRLAVVVGVNAPPTAHAELKAALDEAKSKLDDIGHPVALVGTPVKVTKNLPYGTWRNQTLSSDAHRHAVEAMVAKGTHPYISIQDFDTGSRAVDGGKHAFDHVIDSLRVEGGSSAKPLAFSGGYRVSADILHTTRKRLMSEQKQNEDELRQFDDSLSVEERAAIDKALAEKAAAAKKKKKKRKEEGQEDDAQNEGVGEEEEETGAKEKSPLEIKMEKKESLVARQAALAKGEKRLKEPGFVSDFTRVVNQDMTARDRLAKLAPLFPYSPEPNLFIDAIPPLVDERVRFGGGGAEADGLTTALATFNARELRALYPDARYPSNADSAIEDPAPDTTVEDNSASALHVDASTGRHAIRGQSYVADFTGAATETDLSRLALEYAKTGNLPQTHAALTNVVGRLHDNKNKAAKAGLSLKNLQDDFPRLARSGTSAVNLSVFQDGPTNGQPQGVKSTPATVGLDRPLNPRISTAAGRASDPDDSDDHKIRTGIDEDSSEQKIMATLIAAFSGPSAAMQLDFHQLHTVAVDERSGSTATNGLYAAVAQSLNENGRTGDQLRSATTKFLATLDRRTDAGKPATRNIRTLGDLANFASDHPAAPGDLVNAVLQPSAPPEAVSLKGYVSPDDPRKAERYYGQKGDGKDVESPNITLGGPRPTPDPANSIRNAEAIAIKALATYLDRSIEVQYPGELPVTHTPANAKKARTSAKAKKAGSEPAVRIAATPLPNGRSSFSASPATSSLRGPVFGIPDVASPAGDRSEQEDSGEPSTVTPRAELPHSTQSHRDVAEWVGNVNNDGDPLVAPVGDRLTNCGPTTWAVFDRLSGTPSFGRAHPVQLRAEDVGDVTGLPLRASDPDGIANQLRNAGVGAHTVVAARFGNGVVHSFNAMVDGDGVWAVDGQHGTITAWPPSLGREGNPVTGWFVGTPASPDEEFNVADERLARAATSALPTNADPKAVRPPETKAERKERAAREARVFGDFGDPRVVPVRFDDGRLLGGNSGVHLHVVDGRKVAIKPSRHGVRAVKTELLAQALYRAAGAPTLQATPVLVEGRGSQIHLMSDFLDGKVPDERVHDQFGGHPDVARFAAADMLLSNWDSHKPDAFISTGRRVVRIDVGGSLDIRAQGEIREGWAPADVATGDFDVEEIKPGSRMRSKGPFKDLTDAQIADSIRVVADRFTPDAVDAAIRESGYPHVEGAKLKAVLRARVEKALEWADAVYPAREIQNQSFGTVLERKPPTALQQLVEDFGYEPTADLVDPRVIEELRSDTADRNESEYTTMLSVRESPVADALGPTPLPFETKVQLEPPTALQQLEEDFGYAPSGDLVDPHVIEDLRAKTAAQNVSEYTTMLSVHDSPVADALGPKPYAFEQKVDATVPEVGPEELFRASQHGDDRLRKRFAEHTAMLDGGVLIRRMSKAEVDSFHAALSSDDITAVEKALFPTPPPGAAWGKRGEIVWSLNDTFKFTRELKPGPAASGSASHNAEDYNMVLEIPVTAEMARQLGKNLYISSPVKGAKPSAFQGNPNLKYEGTAGGANNSTGVPNVVIKRNGFADFWSTVRKVRVFDAAAHVSANKYAPAVETKKERAAREAKEREAAKDIAAKETTESSTGLFEDDDDLGLFGTLLDDEPPQAPSPRLPSRSGPDLVLGGMDVVESFHSEDRSLQQVRELVTRLGGEKTWDANRERLTALFSDDGLKSKVAGMLRGGKPVSYAVELGSGRTLSVDLRLDPAASSLEFKENVKDYEFEHSSDPSSVTGSFDEGRRTYVAGAQASLTHANATHTTGVFGVREHQWSESKQRTDRQISGGQTVEPATRFGGDIQGVVSYRVSGPGIRTGEAGSMAPVLFQAKVAVPTRAVADAADPAAISDGPPRVTKSRALTGSDVVTNLQLIPDGVGPHRGPQSTSGLVTSPGMRAAFESAYGTKARQAMNEVDEWLSVEVLQANLHGMTNKQPLVHHLGGVGGRVEVHAFVESLGTPSDTTPAHGEQTSNSADPTMRATGETSKTEFHFGTETDSARVRQDQITYTAQLPLPGRSRGHGGTPTGEVVGGLDGGLNVGRSTNEVTGSQFRDRSTLKNPVAGQAWNGQVRLRFVMHGPDSVSPMQRDGAFTGGVHETRATFDVLVEKSETTPITDYRGKKVFAPPNRIWGRGGPPADRNSSTLRSRWPWGRGVRPVVATNDSSAPRERGVAAEPLAGLGSMDRVTNLDLSGFHGMLDSMGHRAFGSKWNEVRPTVAASNHLNRIRSGLPGMTQHSPLTTPELSGRGSSSTLALTADIENLTYRRTIDKVLSSPSMENTEGTTTTTITTQQISGQAALGGRGGDVAGGPVLGEVIGGANRTVRDGDRVREQQRMAVATKFEQPMAIFDGWVRIDATMTGTKAAVHESGLFPVEIAIPLSELQGSRTHDAELPPTFDRSQPAGFVETPPVAAESSSAAARSAPGPAPLSWDPPVTMTEPPALPTHALSKNWQPTDMLIGLDPASGLLDAIRTDLGPALGKDLDRAMAGVDQEFGPQVLQARLAHQSGQQWSHDIPITGGRITVKVRAIRDGDPAKSEYVGRSTKFETDLSVESQSSTARLHDDLTRHVEGGRLVVPFPHGSASVQVTHSGSVLHEDAPSASPNTSDLTTPRAETTVTDTEHRTPTRVRTTEAHDLFRQPIRFEISYERHQGARLLSNVPEDAADAILTGVFAYPHVAPAEHGLAGHLPTEPAEGPGIQLDARHVVTEVRPPVKPPAPQPPAPAGLPTPTEDAVAAHVLDSMAEQGREVFGDEWSAVRTELAQHVGTRALHRGLGDYSRGGQRTIELKSVRGGKVVLSARVDAMTEPTQGTAKEAEFYTGGQTIKTVTDGNAKTDNWNVVLQAQGTVLPVDVGVNASLLGRVDVNRATDSSTARTRSSTTGELFRKKAAAHVQAGTATLRASMSRPTGFLGKGARRERDGVAKFDFRTRRPSTDVNQDHYELPNGGLPSGSIVRAVFGGDQFRQRTADNLKAPVSGIAAARLRDRLPEALGDVNLQRNLPAMARGEEIELFRDGPLRITGRASMTSMKFAGVEREGGMTNLLNEVNQGELQQDSSAWEAGVRFMAGPHGNLGGGLRGNVMAGGGGMGRSRHGTTYGQSTKVSANAKFAGIRAVFDGVAEIVLTVHDGDSSHTLPGEAVHGPILIPTSQVQPIQTPSERPASVPTPSRESSSGARSSTSSTGHPGQPPGTPIARTSERTAAPMIELPNVDFGSGLQEALDEAFERLADD